VLTSHEYAAELEFLKSLWGLGTEEEEGYRTGPPGYIGWRKSFLGIDSGAPYTLNTGSVLNMYYILWVETMRSKARGLAQNGGPPGWMEESDPAGVILYVMDGPYCLPFPYCFQLLFNSKCR
jgi:hypothetical protein